MNNPFGEGGRKADGRGKFIYTYKEKRDKRHNQIEHVIPAKAGIHHERQQIIVICSGYPVKPGMTSFSF
jgi:hypothetical protein